MSRCVMACVVAGVALVGCASREPVRQGDAGAKVEEMKASEPVRQPISEPEVVAKSAPAKDVVAARPVEPAAPVVQPAAPVTNAEPVIELKEAFPHVKVDAKAKVVEVEGIVPIDAHDKSAPQVFLEVAVCSPDTKEHESLVVTKASASHLHAALLLVGAQPGSPGKWDYVDQKLVPTAPKGDEVGVTIVFKDAKGQEVSYTPQQMVVDARTGKHFGEAKAGRWVFAGSQIIKRRGREVYDADGAGTVVGLTTFGSETIAWTEVISPEASVEEPTWIADATTTPAVGTPVTVRIVVKGK